MRTPWYHLAKFFCRKKIPSHWNDFKLSFCRLKSFFFSSIHIAAALYSSPKKCSWFIQTYSTKWNGRVGKRMDWERWFTSHDALVKLENVVCTGWKIVFLIVRIVIFSEIHHFSLFIFTHSLSAFSSHLSHISTQYSATVSTVFILICINRQRQDHHDWHSVTELFFY